MSETITGALRETLDVLSRLLADERLLQATAAAAGSIVAAYRKGSKVLTCGNGGSAADAQHIAAELSGRFFFDRQPLAAEALHVNSSYMTAVANDYSFDDVFCRLARAQGKRGDVLIALSTSGNSRNIIKALEEAKRLGMATIGLTGQGPNLMETLCDHLLAVPSRVTPRIQECHIALGHIICEIVESRLFSETRPVIFLDRDGVINRKMPEDGYVVRWKDFSFLPGVFKAIRLFNDNGYLVAVVTNQQCIAKGIVTEQEVHSIHDNMIAACEAHGARIDGIYLCPHLAAENCSCRKPAAGLFDAAQKAFQRKGVRVDRKRSYMIGDSESDITAGRRAGLNVLGIGENLAGSRVHCARDLVEAARLIVNGDMQRKVQ